MSERTCQPQSHRAQGPRRAIQRRKGDRERRRRLTRGSEPLSAIPSKRRTSGGHTRRRSRTRAQPPAMARSASGPRCHRVIDVFLQAADHAVRGCAEDAVDAATTGSTTPAVGSPSDNSMARVASPQRPPQFIISPTRSLASRGKPHREISSRCSEWGCSVPSRPAFYPYTACLLSAG
jgi:hypothetical protein